MRKTNTVFYCFLTTLLLLISVGGAYPQSRHSHSEEAIRVLDYLQSIHGEAMLASAHTARGARNGNDDLAYIHNTTGQYPAILGLDVGIYRPRGSEDYAKRLHNVSLDARDYWLNAGLVTFTWHWSNPMLDERSYDNTKVVFDIDKALVPGTDQHKRMVEDIDLVAEVLKDLQEAGVPVLWRPLHEMCGGWFWWSKQGKETFQRLWIFLHEHLVDHHGLDNLIWVYSASNKLKMDWYPGDQYADLFGWDCYDKERITQRENFERLKQIARGAPIALTETDWMPDPAILEQKGFYWTWFMTWHTEFLRRNPPDFIKRVYSHPNVITREELPQTLFRLD